MFFALEFMELGVALVEVGGSVVEQAFDFIVEDYYVDVEGYQALLL